MYQLIKQALETFKQQKSVKNFAKILLGKEAEKQKPKYSGFKFLYDEIIKPTEIPNNCSKVNFIKIFKTIKGSSHCGHDHNDQQIADLYHYLYL